jgi:putative oxidoreductase
MKGSENAAVLVGRILMCVLFIWAGSGKLMNPAAIEASFAKQGVPMVEAAWLLAVVVELGGGLALLLGLFTRPVGFVLAVWCVLTALIGHTNFADRMQEINFFKNMVMAGGFLYVAAFGAPAWSVDAWRLQRRGIIAAE